MTPYKEIRVASGNVRVSTFLGYKRALGRVVWNLVAPVITARSRT